jgi:hypothetical protein
MTPKKMKQRIADLELALRAEQQAHAATRSARDAFHELGIRLKNPVRREEPLGIVGKQT